MADWFNYFVPGVRITPPRIVVLDKGSKHYRCGQIIAVSASSVTVKAHLQQNILGELTIARALAPSVILGDPVCLEVTTAEPPFTVTAVHGTGFANHGSGQQQAPSRGEFEPGFVPKQLGGHD
jgi:hypothetical protein